MTARTRAQMEAGRPSRSSAMPVGRLAPIRFRQRGASLIVSLLMLIAVLLLGISAAQMALQSEKASRNDRDRQIAFQAAEAALQDAEMDIENSTDTSSRSSTFSEKPVLANFDADCGQGATNTYLGLCTTAVAGATPVWLKVDFTDTGSSSTRTVPYGKFTGQTMQVGNGQLSSKLPRYLIEVVNYKAAGEDASAQATFFYRVTAMGFGARDTTRVVLQSFYRKVDKP
ncbi:PilX N-terminal domain-containing pilus assembly protein [Undibacterium arcticum]|uniref:PilX N-terminal domain-containing pilus assembly protein n=1 Tax=Undibacterium arcticum TaxID=1762892 RepID=A0ABV7F3W4_9BURK